MAVSLKAGDIEIVGILWSQYRHLKLKSVQMEWRKKVKVPVLN
jgi:hypothetical protein